MWSHSRHWPRARSIRRHAAMEAFAEAVDEGVEVVVLHDEDLAVGMIGVVVGQPPHDLQPHGRLAGTLLAEDDATWPARSGRRRSCPRPDGTRCECRPP